MSKSGYWLYFAGDVINFFNYFDGGVSFLINSFANDLTVSFSNFIGPNKPLPAPKRKQSEIMENEENEQLYIKWMYGIGSPAGAAIGWTAMTTCGGFRVGLLADAVHFKNP